MLAWLFAVISATVVVTGLCVVHTCASTGDIDLERRVEDRTQALLAEHMPIGIRRMLGLGITGLVAVGSIAILLQTPHAVALPILVLLHAGCSAVMGRFAIARLLHIL